MTVLITGEAGVSDGTDSCRVTDARLIVPFRAGTGQLPGLTGARFVAAIAVVATHSSQTLSVPAWSSAFFSLASPAVSFFFVLSGFVLAHTYADRFADGVVLASLRTYARARFARVYPMYLAVLVAAIPLTLGLIYSTGGVPQSIATPEPEGLVVSWLINAATLQGYLPRNQWITLWNPPGWSIGCEAFFYATLPFFVATTLRRLNSTRSALLLVASFYLAELLTVMAMPRLAEWVIGGERGRVIGADLIYFSPPCRVWEFLIGCVLGLAWRRLRCQLRMPSWGTEIAVVLLVFVFVSLVSPAAKMWTGDALTYALHTPLSAMLIVILASGRSKLCGWLDRGPMPLLGEASYSLYLIHWLPLAALRGWRPDLAAIPSVATLIGVGCVFASIGLHIYVERPLRDKLR